MLTIVIVLILLGVVLLFIKPYVEPALYNAAIVIVIVLVFLALLSLLGVFSLPFSLR